MATATYKRYVNDPSTSEQYLHNHSGERVRVLDEIADIDEECKPMFRVEFPDGRVDEAFGEELSDWGN